METIKNNIVLAIVILYGICIFALAFTVRAVRGCVESCLFWKNRRRRDEISR